MEGKLVTNNDQPKLPILLFDSECSLCVRFKDSLSKLQGADEINMISVHEDSTYEHFDFLNKEDCLKEIHFIKEDKNVLVGADVIEHLISLYPLVSKFSWLIESDMGQKAINYFHSMTNKYRHNLKKKCPSCIK